MIFGRFLKGNKSISPPHPQTTTPRPDGKKSETPHHAARGAFDGKTVSLYHWTPRDAGQTNFGDELSPLLVRRILDRSGLADVAVQPSGDGPKLLAVGSVLQQAREGDVVWGAGVNGKNWPRRLKTVANLHVASVRGPLTQRALQRFGFEAPAIFGDPGLLFPELFRDEIAQAGETVRRKYGKADVIYIPNLNDESLLPERFALLPEGVTLVSPTATPVEVAAMVAQARLVISSSLHGLVFADACGVPCRAHLSAFEPIFKYVDYFEGVGRSQYAFHLTIEDALEAADLARVQIDTRPILQAFPFEALGLIPSLDDRNI